MTHDEMIKVIEHHKNGGKVEFLDSFGRWESTEKPYWNFEETKYRIKPKQKQVVVIEKWLCETDGRYEVRESSNIEAYVNGYWKVVKLLDTYEVEL